MSTEIETNGAPATVTTLPKRFADLISQLDESGGKGAFMKISRDRFLALVSERSRSTDSVRVAALQAILKGMNADERGVYTFDAAETFAVDETSPFPQSAYTNVSYWSGTAPGAVSAFNAGGYASELVVGYDKTLKRLAARLTLAPMTEAEAIAYRGKIADLDAKRAKAKADRADKDDDTDDGDENATA